MRGGRLFEFQQLEDGKKMKQFIGLAICLFAASPCLADEWLLPRFPMKAWAGADDEKKVAFASIWALQHSDSEKVPENEFDGVVGIFKNCMNLEADRIKKHLSKFADEPLISAVATECFPPR